jgi:L-seryl-tRNA(Ser) seleniumtransferase
LSLYRQLPKVDGLLSHPEISPLPHDVAVSCIRVVLDRVRADISQGVIDQLPDFVPLILSQSVLLLRGRMRRVINATGIVVHTNLGRSPWPACAVEAAMATASGYCNLEMDLSSGKRGGRLDGFKALAQHLTGCEEALVVNNCASAVLLALSTLAPNREVLVSRSELVEIGGSYRVPDVIEAGGARLVEVGTTNRTRIADYENAITEDTALLLKVHHSNFRIVGFTEEASLEELVALGKERGLPVVHDLGSGGMVSLCGEPTVAACVASGVDVTVFSGDKLLGGPQAGLIVGGRETLLRMRKHPMYRALRVGKVTLAALEATLALFARGGRSPVVEMIEMPLEEISHKAELLMAALSALSIPSEVQQASGYVGGGAIPETLLPTVIVVIEREGIDRFCGRLRASEPAVVGRIHNDALCLDLRTVTRDEIALLANCVAQCWGTA